MKKVDLHIHTKKGVSDRPFEFDLEVLKQYVSKSKLDIIGVTNHNLFDPDNFDEINDALNIEVLPGVEVDIESAHILVLTSIEGLPLFKRQCELLSTEITHQDDEISFDKFKEIFYNFQDYIIIPHYENKKPAINIALLSKFASSITAGEVSNPKRWNICKKNNNKLVPVLFSDFRAEKETKVFPNTGTFLDIGDINFNNIKLTLTDKNRVFIDLSKSDDEFGVHGNVSASTKLNLVVGRRSSGKTHLLDSIVKSYPDSEVKYISQFSIVKNAEEKEFLKLLNKDSFITTQDYLKTLGVLMKNYQNIDILNNYQNITTYITTLKKYAEEKDLEDVFSSAKLFTETQFTNLKVDSVSELVDAIKTILDNNIYKVIIESKIDRGALILLLDLLLNELEQQKISIKAKSFSNEIITLIKGKLDLGSSRTQVTDVDFCQIAKDVLRVEYFDRLMSGLLVESEIDELEVNPGRFSRKVLKRSYASANDLKKYNKVGQVSIKNQFEEHYMNKKYFDFLIDLKNLSDELVNPKHLVCLEYSLKNDRNTNVSGGERAEYLLSKEIDQASKYDFLLIDEPEASFDNIFLNASIRSMIRDISSNTTTFVTTHNSSLGAELMPNKLLYTEYNDGEFTVYSGKFGAEDLVDQNNVKIACSKVIYDTLESGKEIYKNRGKIYENLEN